MFSKKVLLIFFALVAALAITGCIFQNQDGQTQTPSGNTTVEYKASNTVPSNGGVTPSFRVGDRFEYETTKTGWQGSAKTIFIVKDIEKIGNREYYVVSKDYRESYKTLSDTRNNSRQATYYFDTETGYFLKRVEGGKTIEEGDGSADVDMQLGNIMFGPWMLSLNENFEWSRNVESNIGGKISKYVNSFEVTETPIQNGRKAFKVEYKIIRDGIVSRREVFWVDSEKRINVKKEVFSETGAKVAEVKLKLGLN